MTIEAPTTPRPPKLPSLTGLRFFAALLVFGFHITLSASPIPPNGAISPFADEGVAKALEAVFLKTGYIGVSFFFVLSGFLIAWASKPGERVWNFWRRRLLKIYPNHIVMWVVSMVLFAAAITAPSAFVLNFFLLNSFSPDGATYIAVNPPSWTLCSELLFYMLFPLLIVPLRKIAPQRLWFWAALMVVGMIAVQLITIFVIPSTPASPITPISVTQFWFGYIFPPSRLFEFILGCILARLVMEGRWPKIKLWQLAVVSLAGYGLANVVPFVFAFNVATIIPIALVIGTIAARDAAGVPSFLANKPMQWLGNTSFGFYLSQGVVIFYLRQAMGNETYPTPIALLVVLGFFVLTVLAGWALYALVEKPMMDRFARPKRRPIEATLDEVEQPVSVNSR